MTKKIKKQYSNWKKNNVIQMGRDAYVEQSSQYQITFTSYQLQKYFIKEFINHS